MEVRGLALGRDRTLVWWGEACESRVVKEKIDGEVDGEIKVPQILSVSVSLPCLIQSSAPEVWHSPTTVTTTPSRGGV